MPANGSYAALLDGTANGIDLDGHDFAASVKDPTRRAYVIAYALTGFKTRACKAVGISESMPYQNAWKEDETFQAAMLTAEEIIAHKMVDEAKRRGVEGMQRYRFTKSGEAIQHPTDCECGHGLAEHPRLDDLTAPRKCGATVDGKSCACSRFHGVPYYEHEYSDRMLEMLLKGALPETYGQKVELKGALATLDMTRLPDGAIDRIRAGEHPLQVLASMTAAGGILLGPGSGESEPGGTDEL